jgi:hypothetical protein
MPIRTVKRFLLLALIRAKIAMQKTLHLDTSRLMEGVNVPSGNHSVVIAYLREAD